MTHYAPTFDPEKGAYVLDKVILHVLPPFVHLTGGDDGGGGEFLHIADELQLSIRSKLAA